MELHDLSMFEDAVSPSVSVVIKSISSEEESCNSDAMFANASSVLVPVGATVSTSLLNVVNLVLSKLLLTSFPSAFVLACFGSLKL